MCIRDRYQSCAGEGSPHHLGCEREIGNELRQKLLACELIHFAEYSAQRLLGCWFRGIGVLLHLTISAALRNLPALEEDPVLGLQPVPLNMVVPGGEILGSHRHSSTLSVARALSD